jgi:long-subunit acyl-CoA synthetase (AMP-forming)
MSPKPPDGPAGQLTGHSPSSASPTSGSWRGYGLTETASTTTFNKSVTDRRAYSVGKPIWGMQTQVRDSGGDALPPGKDNVGEVVTRGLAYCRERVAAYKLPKNTSARS